jgi:hypothetical protein
MQTVGSNFQQTLMTKPKLQIAIATIGLISIWIGVRTILQIPTMIISPWFLVGLYLTIAILVSFVIGYLIKAFLKSRWHTLTFTALAMTVICLSFYISQYKPGYKINIPDNYVSDVRLLVSNEKENDFKINDFGIGYINKKTFEKGFNPTIIKAGHDITKQISGYATGSYATTSASKLSLDYVTFEIPGKKENAETINFDSLLILKAIDPTRLLKK